jgi:hypothetical protein
MTRTRLGLLGLCAMVFGLMAFGASAAQAETGAKWLVGGTGFLEAEIGLENDGEEEYPYVLHSEILKIKVLFLCKKIKIAAGLSGNPKLIANGGISSGKVLFSGCLTDLNGTKNSLCTPKDVTEGVEGTILTRNLDSLIRKHALAGGAVDDVLELLPHVAGDPFATIEMGAGCSIGTKVPVFGKLFLEDCENLALVRQVKHLVKPFTELTRLWVISDTAEHAATLLGSAWGFLTGAHENVAFAGDPAP